MLFSLKLPSASSQSFRLKKVLGSIEGVEAGHCSLSRNGKVHVIDFLTKKRHEYLINLTFNLTFLLTYATPRTPLCDPHEGRDRQFKNTGLTKAFSSGPRQPQVEMISNEQSF